MSTQRKHTRAALQVLEDHLANMMVVVRAAADGDNEALDEVMSEYGGCYTKVYSLINKVGHGIQNDDDDQFRADEKLIEAEELLRSIEIHEPPF